MPSAVAFTAVAAALMPHRGFSCTYACLDVLSAQLGESVQHLPREFDKVNVSVSPGVCWYFQLSIYCHVNPSKTRYAKIFPDIENNSKRDVFNCPTLILIGPLEERPNCVYLSGAPLSSSVIVSQSPGVTVWLFWSSSLVPKV